MYYKLKFYRIDYFKWLSKYLYVDVIGYDYPGYGLHKYSIRIYIMCRGIPSEESIKQTGCSVLNFIIDTFHIPPNRIIL